MKKFTIFLLAFVALCSLTLEVMAAPPSLQARYVGFTNAQSTSVTVSWINGNGTNRIAVAAYGGAANWTAFQTSFLAAITNINNVVDANGDFNIAFASSTNKWVNSGITYVIMDRTTGQNRTSNFINLTTNTQYHVKVFEFNLSGNMPQFNYSNAFMNPRSFTPYTITPPTGLAMNYTCFSGGQIAWTTDGANAAGYFLTVTDLSTSTVVISALDIGLPVSKTYTITGLNPSTNYKAELLTYDAFYNTASSTASVNFSTTGGAPVISGTASVCANTLGVTYTVSPAFTTYFWTVSGGTIAAGQGTNTLTVDWGPGGIGTVSVAVTDGSGCTGSASYTVTVNPLPNPPISGNTTVCANVTGQTYSITGSYSSISWTCSGGTIVGPTNMSSISVNWGAAGVGNVTVNVTDLNGCSGSTVLPVTKIALPTPAITGPAGVCDGQIGVTYSVGAFNSYSWTVLGGTITAGQNTSSITVDWGTAGAGSVSIAVTDINGCVGTDNLPVTINALPTVTLGTNPQVCQGTPTANLPYSGATGTPTQYSIDYDAAANTAGFVDVAWTGLPVSPIALTIPGVPAGVYNATLKVRNALLCESAAYSFTVTIEGTPIAGTLTKSPNVATVCAGTAVSATLTPGSGGNGTDETQYSTNAGGTWTTYTSGNSISTTGLSGANVVQIRTRRLAAICATSAWNTVMWSVEATPVAQTINKTPAGTHVCQTSNASATFSGGSGGDGTNSYHYRTSNDGGVNWTGWTAYTSGNPIAAAGLTHIEVRATRNASACTPATNTVSWIVEGTPVAQTITKSPNTASVCAGTNVSATFSGGSGGNGTNTYEYRTSTNGGGTWTGWTTYGAGNPIITTGLTNVEVRATRNAIACTPATNTASWTVEATPVAPTITKSPNTTVVCGTSSVNATFTGGSGGNGINTYESRTSADGGMTWTPWVAYTGGTPIAAAGLTNIQIRATRNASACTPATNTVSWTVEAIPVAQTITKSPNVASVCDGTPVSATFSGGSGGNGTNTYEYRYNGAGAWSAYTPGNNLSTTGYTQVEIRTTRNADHCTPVTSTVSWTINPLPTITLGANPSVCFGSTPANLTYSATTGGANQYSIDFDLTANGAGFVDVGWTALPASPITIAVPAAPAGVYNAVLKVRNSGTTCESQAYNITVTINALPTITLGTNPSVCQGTTSTNLTYSATTESPTDYTINFDGAAEAQGFVDVAWTSLPTSPIVITVPAGAAVGTYNAILNVRNANTCVSNNYNITVTVVAPPSITGHPANVSSGVGSNVSFSVTALNTTSYQWYYDNDNSGYDGTPISGATSATLNLNNIQYSHIGYYYCEAINAGCGNVFSNYASLTVYPATQVSGIYFTARSKNTITIQFTAGSGDAHIIAVKQSNSIAPTTPTNNTSYTANTQFPLGDDLGNNAYVILNGTATNVTVTNLAQNTAYYFRGFTYANYSGMILYNPNSATNNPKVIYTTPRETDFAVVGNRFEMNSIAPNPVRDELVFDLFAPASESVKIEIIDLNGEVKWSNDYRIGEGYNTISFYMNNLPVQLSAGTYVLRINGSESLTQKFIYMP